jgi:UDP-N-acetylglucosamine acyltransferase
VVLDGQATLGRNNTIHAHAVIGGIPQDKKYANQETSLTIGDGNTIREFCTINLGTVEGGGQTKVGDRNWIMAYVHVAHDCLIGNDCVLANGVQLAGHVEVQDWVVLGGMTGVHQFCKIGTHVMAGVSSVITQDVMPYVTVGGHPVSLYGLNSTGLKRRGFDDEALLFLKKIYRLLFRSGLALEQARVQIASLSAVNEQQKDILLTCLSFIEGASRGIVR